MKRGQWGVPIISLLKKLSSYSMQSRSSATIQIWLHLSTEKYLMHLVTIKQTVRSLGGPEFPVDNHKSSVASEGSGHECRAGITVRPTQSPLSFLRDRGSLSHKLLHQEETTQNCCSTNAHLGIVCQCVRFTFDGSVASLPFPPI